MLCTRCKMLLPPPRETVHVPQPPVDVHVERLRTLVCSHCGALLPSNHWPDDELLGKLTQLAQFGLAADDKGLLEPGGEDT